MSPISVSLSPRRGVLRVELPVVESKLKRTCAALPREALYILRPGSPTRLSPFRRPANRAREPNGECPMLHIQVGNDDLFGNGSAQFRHIMSSELLEVMQCWTKST